eukprot:TRINITY_DN37679_c0_g1_i1.p1 TRINITY_DN37679_c0_g1~~TRINITY_DN37679_c0_g1_i1.p1  ORF type:complete len:436 (+),score=97.45 TRINITY_DN37679_c0_g1_i1:173-1480(+)
MAATLQAAGSLVAGGPAGYRGATPIYGATLGVRSLREEYAKPTNRPAITRNLTLIEQYLKEGDVVIPERTMFPRFAHLFTSGEKLPPGVFLQALEMGTAETLNGRSMPFDVEVMTLRDNLVAAYKPLTGKIRSYFSKEIADLPYRMVAVFVEAWCLWEAAWLRNREVHAVEALQPLAKAILSLEPLLLSVEKEKLLPWPRVKHQKVVTLKCLEGFVHSLSDLTACVLPATKRELDPDPRLLLLMEHVLMLRGDKSVNSCLQGVAATPDVSFPEHRPQGGGPSAHSLDLDPGMTAGDLLKAKSAGVPLDAYAFRLLGASVGDALASGKVSVIDGRPPCPSKDGTPPLLTMGRRAGQAIAPPPGPKDTDVHRKAAHGGAELLAAFEGVKDLLLSLKSTLEHIDPALDKDPAFVSHLHRFERAFHRSKRIVLEPDNLA